MIEGSDIHIKNVPNYYHYIHLAKCNIHFCLCPNIKGAKPLYVTFQTLTDISEGKTSTGIHLAALICSKL